MISPCARGLKLLLVLDMLSRTQVLMPVIQMLTLPK